ncbi:MAG: hypothetical protein KDC67_16070, partial [Ignavibacteriae bacterium]|nr:hypothetical protein [Ignavibacteriota bacterium]
EPVFKGFFNTNRSFKTGLYSQIASSRLAEMLNLKDRYQPTSHDFELMCAIIKKSKILIQKQLPHATFITVALPFWFENNLFVQTKDCLEKNNIPVFNLEKIFDGSSLQQVQIINDGHATPYGNELIAKGLIKYLSDLDL